MPVGVGNLVRKPNITEPVKEIIGKKSTSSKPDTSCQYLNLRNNSYMLSISQRIKAFRKLRYIAESITGDQRTGKDDITNFGGL
jgi:hypothetical protein